MERQWISLGRKRRRKIRGMARTRGVDESDLIRQAVDQFLDRAGEAERLERFRRAVRESAGAAPEISTTVARLGSRRIRRS